MKRLLAAATLLIPATAAAGGLSRPNGVDPRATGEGGAGAALVDDAFAVYFNPAALADAPAQVDIGGELVVGRRTFTEPGQDKETSKIASPLPALGALGRFSSDEDAPSRVTFGAALYNSYGGKLSWPATGRSAFDSTEDLLLEVGAGAAIRVSDKLSIGAALRVGLGLFQLTATQRPFDADMSGNGVGLGGAVGVVFTPTPRLRFGLGYHTPMKVTTTGSGSITLDPNAPPTRSTISHVQNWPQAASLAASLAITRAFRLDAQVDWTAWSIVDNISVTIDQLGAAGILAYNEQWRDSYAARLGFEIGVTQTVKLRAGGYIDTSAVGDRVLERQYYDTTKYGGALGATYAPTPTVAITAAADFTTAPTRHVVDNTTATAEFPADRNIAPGDYGQALATVELSVAYRF